MKHKETTDLLNNKLLQSDNIEEFIKKNQNELSSSDFCDYLYALVAERGLKNTQAIAQAQMSESYGYQLFNGRRQPSRDKVLQLALGISLTLSETNRLLMLASKSELYVRDKRDAVFMFAINKKMSVIETEKILNSQGLPSLLE